MDDESQDGGRILHVFSNILPQNDLSQNQVSQAHPSCSSHNKLDSDLPPEVPSRRWLYWQMTRAVAKKVVRAPVSLHTWGALRRTILSNFLPDNMAYRYKAYQKGECNRCGLCCKIQFQCPFFVDEGEFNTRCSIYETPHAPSACLKFPLDPTDLKLLQREVGNACTFYFEGAPKKLNILEFVRLYTEGVRQQLSKRKLKEAADTVD